MKRRMLSALLALFLLLSGPVLAADTVPDEPAGTVGPIGCTAGFPNLSLARFRQADGPRAEDGETPDLFADMKEQIVRGLTAAYAGGEPDWFEVKNTSGVSVTLDDFFTVYYNALYDYPEATWFVQTGIARVARPKDKTAYQPDEVITMLPIFFMDLDSEAFAAAVDRAAAACFTEGMTDLEKAASAHDWLVTHCCYDPYVGNGEADYVTAGGQVFTKDTAVYSSYGVFVNGKAVCQGYALALKVLLDRAGVPCFYVCTKYHAWNMVELGGSWYHLDSTWDDPFIDGIGDCPGFVRRTLFLLDDEEIAADEWHTDWTTEFDLASPAAFPMPEVLAGGSLPVMLMNGSLCLATAAGDFLVFAPGSDFAEAAADIPCPQGIYASAAWKDTAYLRDSAHGIWELDLSAAQPQALQRFTADENSYGLELSELPREGLALLRTFTDYDVTDCWTLGLTQTDGGMAAVLRYPEAMKTIEDLDGKHLLVDTEEADVHLWMAVYAEGRMCSIIPLTPDEKGSVALSSEAAAGETDTVKLLAVSSELKVLSSAIELHRGGSVPPEP